ncbi:MAG TPA: DNA polymerase IV [Acidimicrobiales bacterium]|nr:DNA polymerase IV [Acidimicrobiales bacterium]
MSGPGPATILHADLDAFYASVEQLLDPRLRGKPVAVGGGVVLAASYEAKAFGVAAGMAGWRARQLCPKLRFVAGHFRQYQQLGDQVVDVLGHYTPNVERISIDEAFLDVAGSTHLFGSPAAIAAQIRSRVRDEVGLAVSVGVAGTKHLAKIASQVAKPDGLVVVERGRELDFLRPLPVELVWGVGPATRAQLAAKGIHTIGELAATPTPLLQGLLGQAVGAKLGALATDRDPRRVQGGRRAASVGAQVALGRRWAEPDVIRGTLAYLADRVAGRLRAAGQAGRTITVRVRFPGMRSVTRSITLPRPVSATLTLTEVAAELVAGALADNSSERQITLLAVSVSHLVGQPAVQLELPLGFGDERLRPGSEIGAARSAVDQAVDRVRARFGREAVGYATVALSDERRVPDEFRELAESSLAQPEG